MTDDFLTHLHFPENGLLPAIAQDAASGEVLMLAWVNAESLRLTLKTGEVHYWSRSRQEIWRKGATSGHVQKLKQLRFDCDGDAILFLVEQTGPACHTHRRSCFYHTIGARGVRVILEPLAE